MLTRRSFLHSGLALGTLPLLAPAGFGRKEQPLIAKFETLEARLIAKRAKYVLDLGDKTDKEFLAQIRQAEQDVAAHWSSAKFPPAPAVDLILELRNPGRNAIPLKIGGDDGSLTLALEGHGAVSVTTTFQFTTEYRSGQPVTLQPGESYLLDIKSLTYGFRGVANRAYWTKPGEYTLTAAYHSSGGRRHGGVAATSGPVKLQVVAPKPSETT
jgi:hypothetical protein